VQKALISAEWSVTQGAHGDLLAQQTAGWMSSPALSLGLLVSPAVSGPYPDSYLPLAGLSVTWLFDPCLPKGKWWKKKDAPVGRFLQ
jgi:hypothetical protein